MGEMTRFASRRAWRTAAALAGLAVALNAAAANAATIDHGPAGSGTQCSSDPAQTTCLLPFGVPATESTAITSVAVGDTDPGQLLIAHPDAGNPGSWTVHHPLGDSLHWAERAGTSGAGLIVDTAIRLEVGDVLVIIDPLIRAGGPVTDFDTPAGAPIDSTLVTGLGVPVEPTGSITVEPDADSDGFGDTSEDLCPGIARPICAPGKVSVSIEAPAYVPALDPVVAKWTVTNTGETTQPFVLNWSSPTTVDHLDGPAGTVCAPGRIFNPSEAFVPPATRSPLASKLLTSSPLKATTTGVLAFGMSATDTTGCRLPPLAPGAAWTGTITGTGWVGTPMDWIGVRVEALVPYWQENQREGISSNAYARTVRGDSSKPVANWAPSPVLSHQAATRSGRLLIMATCRPPQPGIGCGLTGELRTSIGAKVLAKLTTPVVPGASRTAMLPFVFSKTGMRWLAAHPRTKSLRAVITATYPHEVPTASSTQIFLTRSPGLERALAKLAHASHKH